jgi:phosphate transport system permease protein
MKLPPNPQRYFEKKSNENLTAGLLVCLAAFVLAVFVVTSILDMAINHIDAIEILGWMGYFNNYVIDFAAVMLFMLPIAALVTVAYILFEGHPIGWKVSYITAIVLVAIGVNQTINGQIVFGIAGSLMVIAATIMLKHRKNTTMLDSAGIVENVAKVGLSIAGIISVSVLLGMICYVGIRGAEFLTWDFLSGKWLMVAARQSVLDSGTLASYGIADYIIGSILLVTLCEAIAIPLGLCAAIYLSEYATQNRFTDTIRFFIETLAGVPSVVIGLVGYAFFANQLGFRVCLLAGALALMMMVLPWNIRVAEEAIKSVPFSYREGAYALGATQSQAIGKIILYAASPGVITGIILGVGKAIGETAVIILTVGFMTPNGLPSSIIGDNQFVPAIPIWVTLTPGFFLQKGVDFVTAYNVAYAGAFVLIAIFIIICIVGLFIRNYLSKKITGRD